MRKTLFHPNQFNQQHMHTRTRGNSQLGELYATQPEHVVHNVLSHIEENELDLSNEHSFSDIIDSNKK